MDHVTTFSHILRQWRVLTMPDFLRYVIGSVDKKSSTALRRICLFFLKIISETPSIIFKAFFWTLNSTRDSELVRFILGRYPTVKLPRAMLIIACLKRFFHGLLLFCCVRVWKHIVSTRFFWGVHRDRSQNQQKCKNDEATQNLFEMNVFLRVKITAQKNVIFVIDFAGKWDLPGDSVWKWLNYSRLCRFSDFCEKRHRLWFGKGGVHEGPNDNVFKTRVFSRGYWSPISFFWEGLCETSTWRTRNWQSLCPHRLPKPILWWSLHQKYVPL